MTEKTRFSPVKSQFQLSLCFALAGAGLSIAISGCGEYKPPTFGEIVDKVKNGDTTEAKKETPKPAPTQQAAAPQPITPLAPANPSTNPQVAPQIGLGGEGQGQAAAPARARTPEEFIAEFDKNGSIVVDDNGLKSVIGALGDRTDLVTKLDMTGAHVSPDGMQLLAKFPKLVDLNLSNAALTSASCEPLAKLVGLEKLNLSQSSITDPDLVYIRDLVHLKELNVSKIKDVSDEGHTNFAKFRQLEVLDISLNNRITGDGFASVRKQGGMSPLRVLIANNTQFGKVGMNSLAGLKSLETLEVADSSLTNTSLGGLRSCPKLKWLILDENRSVTDKGLVELERLKQLEHLEARNLTRMSDLGLSQVKGARNLQFVNVDGTGVTNSGLRGLKKLIPNVQIKWQGKIYE